MTTQNAFAIGQSAAQILGKAPSLRVAAQQGSFTLGVLDAARKGDAERVVKIFAMRYAPIEVKLALGVIEDAKASNTPFEFGLKLVRRVPGEVGKHMKMIMDAPKILRAFRDFLEFTEVQSPYVWSRWDEAQELKCKTGTLGVLSSLGLARRVGTIYEYTQGSSGNMKYHGMELIPPSDDDGMWRYVVDSSTKTVFRFQGGTIFEVPDFMINNILNPTPLSLNFGGGMEFESLAAIASILQADNVSVYRTQVREQPDIGPPQYDAMPIYYSNPSKYLDPGDPTIYEADDPDKPVRSNVWYEGSSNVGMSIAHWKPQCIRYAYEINCNGFVWCSGLFRRNADEDLKNVADLLENGEDPDSLCYNTQNYD